jgi:hypothetical protein
MTMGQRFTSSHGRKRYSLGYPACRSLEDQAVIWKFLKPEEIGVRLIDRFMLDSEAGVSALAFHHPDCTYFSASDAGQDGSSNQIDRSLIVTRSCLNFGQCLWVRFAKSLFLALWGFGRSIEPREGIAPASWRSIAGALGTALASRGLSGGLLFVGNGSSGPLACLPCGLNALTDQGRHGRRVQR